MMIEKLVEKLVLDHLLAKIFSSLMAALRLHRALEVTIVSPLTPDLPDLKLKLTTGSSYAWTTAWTAWRISSIGSRT